VSERPLILASGSPRRSALLREAGVRFEVRAPNIPEVQRPDEAPADVAARLAREKALAVARQIAGPRRLVLGADTIVIIDHTALGKPVDAADAERLLQRLLGRRHRVVTAVAIVASDTLAVRETVVESEVVMREADAEEVRAYVDTGEPLDKAGAYAAQGEGRRFIERIEGSLSNVIGLPVEETLALLAEARRG
jgi:septum formation protein